MTTRPAPSLRLRKIAGRLVLGTVGLYALAAGLLYFLQDSLIYLPSRHQPGELENLAAREGFEIWRDGSGLPIGWQSVGGDSAKALLFLHGQGGNALNGAFLSNYSAELGGDWKVFLLEYPGYGDRPGVPSEKSLTASAIEAIDHLASTPGRRIWIVGQSLGSGVACAAVRQRPRQIAGLVLLTPFNSLAATAAHQYSFLPVSAFLRTRFDSEKNLANFPGPVAFFHCEKDSTIPIALARRLSDGYTGRKKIWLDSARDHDASSLLHAEWSALWKWLQESVTDS